VLFYGAVLVLVLFCIIVKLYTAQEESIVYLGMEQRPGWLAPMAIYGFTCRECGQRTKSHNHGRKDRLKLVCRQCLTVNHYGEHSILRRHFDG